MSMQETRKTDFTLEDIQPDYDATAEELSIADKVKVLSPRRLIAKRFFRSKLSIIGLSLLAFLFAFSFFGPLLRYTPLPVYEELQTFEGEGYTVVSEHGTVKIDDETFDYYYVTYTENKLDILSYPDSTNILGTDDQSRDVFSRLMYGGRISLTIGLVVVLIQTVLGVLMGGLAGYFGKWVDQIIMRLVDLFYCIPQFPIMLIASAIIEAIGIDSVARIYFLMILLTFFGWAGTARMVRGQILTLREQEFMLAAEATGLSVKRKIFKHLVPNVMPQLIVSMTLGLGSIILTESTLTYLGLGVPLPYAAWGTMIGRLKDFTILTNHFHLWGPPGICIVLAVLAFNFVGDGLRDAFDPKMKR